jgi:hypothetical protein
MARKAKNVLTDWKTDIENGSFTLFSPYNTSGETIKGASAVVSALLNIVLRKYPLSFDNANLTENFFAIKHLNFSVKLGIAESTKGVITKAIETLLQGAWKVPKYWTVSPQLPISQLKVKVDELIKTALEGTEGRIAISDIFNSLMNEGFTPCNLYSYLTGFLLRDYIDGYQYSDGNSGDKLMEDKLAELITEYVTHLNVPSRYSNKYITKMSKEQGAFINLMANVFHLPSMPIDKLARGVRGKLKELGLPLWCFNKSALSELSGFIDNLSAMASTNNESDHLVKIASTIGAMSLNLPTASNELSSLLTVENINNAIMGFLVTFENGELLAISKEINVESVLSDVRKQLGSGEGLWLWDQETGEEELHKLLIDYKIVRESNLISNAKSTSLKECIATWQEKAKSLRIPYEALSPAVPDLKTFLKNLHEIAITGTLAYDKRNQFLTELTDRANAIKDLFSDKIIIFKNIYSFHLGSLTEAEVDKIYSSLSINSFSSDKLEFERHVSDASKKAKADNEKHALQALWEEKTSSKNPREWSAKTRTPLISLFPSDLRDDAKRAFDAINRNNSEDSEVKFSMEFIARNNEIIESLRDQDKIDDAFLNDIIGRFGVMLPDPDEVRVYLDKTVSTHPYDWQGNTAVKNAIEKFAQARYSQGGSIQALKKIDKMDSEKAKKYLKQLIVNNINVGIEIISDGGNDA